MNKVCRELLGAAEAESYFHKKVIRHCWYTFSSYYKAQNEKVTWFNLASKLKIIFQANFVDLSQKYAKFHSSLANLILAASFSTWLGTVETLKSGGWRLTGGCNNWSWKIFSYRNQKNFTGVMGSGFSNFCIIKDLWSKLTRYRIGEFQWALIFWQW